MEEVSNLEIRTHNYQYSFNLNLLFRLILCCGMVQRCWLIMTTQGTNILHLRLNLLSINGLIEQEILIYKGILFCTNPCYNSQQQMVLPTCTRSCMELSVGAGFLGFDCGLTCIKDSGNQHDFSTSEPTRNTFFL